MPAPPTYANAMAVDRGPRPPPVWLLQQPGRFVPGVSQSTSTMPPVAHPTVGMHYAGHPPPHMLHMPPAQVPGTIVQQMQYPPYLSPAPLPAIVQQPPYQHFAPPPMTLMPPPPIPGAITQQALYPYWAPPPAPMPSALFQQAPYAPGQILIYPQPTEEMKRVGAGGFRTRFPSL